MRTWSSRVPTCDLTDVPVLIVEDEFLIALELELIFRDAGATVVGPCRTVAKALAQASSCRLAAAVLDVRIGSETVEPVARCLASKGVPFLFYTGQARNDPVWRNWPDATVLAKPASAEILVTNVARLSRGTLRRHLSRPPTWPLAFCAKAAFVHSAMRRRQRGVEVTA